MPYHLPLDRETGPGEMSTQLPHHYHWLPLTNRHRLYNRAETRLVPACGIGPRTGAGAEYVKKRGERYEDNDGENDNVVRICG